MAFSSHEGMEIIKKENTFGTVSQYSEEHPTNI